MSNVTANYGMRFDSIWGFFLSILIHYRDRRSLMSDVTASNGRFFGLFGSLEISMFDTLYSLSTFHKFCGKLMKIGNFNVSSCRM